MNDFAPYIVILVSGTLGFSLLTAAGIMYLRTRQHKQRRKSSWSRKSRSIQLWPKIATHAAVKSVAAGLGFALLFLLITARFMGGSARFAALLSGVVATLICYRFILTKKRQRLPSKLSRERKASIPKNRKGADSPAPARGRGKPRNPYFRAGCSSKEETGPRTQPASIPRKPVIQSHIELRPPSSDAPSKPPNMRTSFPTGQGLPNDSSEDDDILPSGYTRSEYHRHGATDADIKFWGLDQPGAPPPTEGGWVIGDVIDKMKQNGW